MRRLTTSCDFTIAGANPAQLLSVEGIRQHFPLLASRDLAQTQRRELVKDAMGAVGKAATRVRVPAE